MPFIITPYECYGIASVLITHYKRGRYTVHIEQPFNAEASFTTTLIAQKGQSKILIETMDTPSLSNALRDFARWLAQRREYCELYVAIRSDSEIMAGLLNEYRQNGIGLIVVDDNDRVNINHSAQNPSLVIGEDPTLRLGRNKTAITDIIKKHNDGSSRDAVRDMCELVEGLTEKVIIKAQEKGWITLTLAQIESMNWNRRIDALAANNSFVAGRLPLLSQNQARDLHSMRGARNLFDHPVLTVDARLDRERQVVERLFMGRRLIHELECIKRSVR